MAAVRDGAPRALLSTIFLSRIVARASRLAPRRGPMTTRSHAVPPARRLLPPAIAATLFLLGLAPGPTAPATDPVPVHIAGIHIVDADQVLLLLADEKE